MRRKQQQPQHRGGRRRRCRQRKGLCRARAHQGARAAQLEQPRWARELAEVRALNEEEEEGEAINQIPFALLGTDWALPLPPYCVTLHRVE